MIESERIESTVVRYKNLYGNRALMVTQEIKNQLEEYSKNMGSIGIDDWVEDESKYWDAVLDKIKEIETDMQEKGYANDDIGWKAYLRETLK